MTLEFLLLVALLVGLLELREWRMGAKHREMARQIKRLSRLAQAQSSELRAVLKVNAEQAEDLSAARQLILSVDTAVKGMHEQFELRIRRPDGPSPDFFEG